MFKLHIETGNAAFDDEPGPELARILETLAARIRARGMAAEFTLADLNGNRVGVASYKAGRK